MTEQDEVAWINSLGFNVTLADLHASYSRFVPTPVPSNTEVQWDTESDMLRNYFRLYLRTGYTGFLQQAQAWHDFFVNTYSYADGKSNEILYNHIYMMGLVDWYLYYQDAPTLAAINRIIDFIGTVNKSFEETRAVARPLQCLCYYNEHIGIRKAECDAMIQQFLAGIVAAPQIGGFVTMRFANSLTPLTVTGVPATVDLRALFPTDASFFNGPDTYPIADKQGVGLYQDCMLLHALRVAAGYLNDPTWANLEARIEGAWKPLIAHPVWDTTGSTNISCPYYILPGAPDLRAWISYEPNTPLYLTQYGPFSTDPTRKLACEQLALLRSYGYLQKIQPSELGGLPRYWPWETWQAGYFLLQK
jgi:hypothetical protein